MAKENNFFIKVQSPRQTRKIILENTRDVLRVLQGYEDYKKLREKRGHLINSFKTDMGEIRSLVLELKRVLPKAGIKEVKKQVLPKETVQKPAKEIKKLEQELADIEEKLSSI